MALPSDLERFIDDNYAPEDRATACSLLANARIETGAMASDRLLRCAAFAGRGDLGKLRRQVSELAVDWRDVVVAGEYEYRDGEAVQVRDFTRPMALQADKSAVGREPPQRSTFDPHLAAMSNSVARAVSIAGHPAVLMPTAAVIASPGGTGRAALAVALLCACTVLGYSFYKARRGDWAHIDASVPAERAQFNVRLGIGLLLMAAALWLIGLHVGFALVVGISSLIPAVGHLSRGVAKLSLHVAFAVFAAFLVWPNHVAAGALAVAAAGVAWSRLALSRHVAADIYLGALTGAAAGLAFQVAVATLAA